MLTFRQFSIVIKVVCLDDMFEDRIIGSHRGKKQKKNYCYWQFSVQDLFLLEVCSFFLWSDAVVIFVGTKFLFWAVSVWYICFNNHHYFKKTKLMFYIAPNYLDLYYCLKLFVLHYGMFVYLGCSFLSLFHSSVRSILLVLQYFCFVTINKFQPHIILTCWAIYFSILFPHIWFYWDFFTLCFLSMQITA